MLVYLGKVYVMVSRLLHLIQDLLVAQVATQEVAALPQLLVCPLLM
jgi:hypothetical protein